MPDAYASEWWTERASCFMPGVSMLACLGHTFPSKATFLLGCQLGIKAHGVPHVEFGTPSI